LSCGAGPPPTELYFLFVGVTRLEDVPVLQIPPANLAAALLQACRSVLSALDGMECWCPFVFESVSNNFSEICCKKFHDFF